MRYLSKHRLLLTGLCLALLAGCSGGGDYDENGSSSDTDYTTTTSIASTSTVPSSTTVPVPDDCSYEGDLATLIECIKAQPLDVATANSAAPSSDVIGQEAYPYTVQEYLEYIIGDLDTQWSAWFLSLGLDEPMMGYHILMPDQAPFLSNCGLPGGEQMVVTHDTVNAFYCSVDNVTTADGTVYAGSIILPVTTLQQMWTGNVFEQASAAQGDFAAAIIVAHEFGHHVQDELYQQISAYNGTPVLQLDKPNSELIADCFAGVWMASAYYTGLLEPNDFEEAVAALEAIGDKDIMGNDHGTPAMRKEALLIGYNGIPGVAAPADPEACIAAYWN